MPSVKVKTYNSREVVVAIGTRAVSVLADDSFLTISQVGNGIMSNFGCDGEVARAIDPNQSYQVQLTLLQTSDSSKYLQSLYDRDIESGDGIFPILIKDIKGGLVFSSENAWVTKQADRGYGKDTNNRQWTIQTANATLKDG